MSETKQISLTDEELDLLTSTLQNKQRIAMRGGRLRWLCESILVKLYDLPSGYPHLGREGRDANVIESITEFNVISYLDWGPVVRCRCARVFAYLQDQTSCPSCGRGFPGALIDQAHQVAGKLDK